MAGYWPSSLHFLEWSEVDVHKNAKIIIKKEIERKQLQGIQKKKKKLTTDIQVDVNNYTF